VERLEALEGFSEAASIARQIRELGAESETPCGSPNNQNEKELGGEGEPRQQVFITYVH
jgi:hypothetical protein